MKIAMILTNGFHPDVRVYKEAKYLASNGNDVTILCWEKDSHTKLPETETLDGIRIIRFKIATVAGTGYRQLRSYFGFVNKCKKYLMQDQNDIIHCHDLDGALVGRIVGGKFIFDMHEFYDRGGKLRKEISHYLTIYLARKAVACIYVADISLKTYGKRIEDKFFLLKNYNDWANHCNSYKTPSKKLRVSYIGTVRHQLKEFNALFEAIKDLDNVEVNVYGGGIDLKELENSANNYKNVKIHGEYNGIDQSRQIYSNTDVSFIAYNPYDPNYKNKFEPVKLYEAISTQTPIIATRAINPGELAERERIGIAVDTRDSAQIREAIEYFINNPEFYRKCVCNLRELSKRYEWSEAVKILDKIYYNK